LVVCIRHVGGRWRWNYVNQRESGFIYVGETACLIVYHSLLGATLEVTGVIVSRR
jgi:hypothetical protein